MFSEGSFHGCLVPLLLGPWWERTWQHDTGDRAKSLTLTADRRQRKRERKSLGTRYSPPHHHQGCKRRDLLPTTRSPLPCLHHLPRACEIMKLLTDQSIDELRALMIQSHPQPTPWTLLRWGPNFKTWVFGMVQIQTITVLVCPSESMTEDEWWDGK
jgi:hypothetical protein